MSCIKDRMAHQGNFRIPVEIPDDFPATPDPSAVQAGEAIRPEGDLPLRMREIRQDDGRILMAAFPSEAERDRGQSTSSLSQPISDFLSHVRKMRSADGVLIRPWGRSFLLTKELLGILFPDTAESPGGGKEQP